MPKAQNKQYSIKFSEKNTKTAKKRVVLGSKKFQDRSELGVHDYFEILLTTTILQKKH